MDSLTQFVLGAGIGEAVLGRKIGNKAILWGGLAGTIPDLDILANPFLDELGKITIHRSFTHSIFFSVVIAPVLAYLLHRWYKNSPATANTTTYTDWLWLFFLGLLTHPLLDALTVYGTQLFWPFTDLRVGINSVFIVDPFYTLPFLITVIWCWRLPKQSPKRRKINRIGLIMSCAYLCFGLVCKQYANYRFEQAFANQNLHVSRYLTDATPFNCLMWYGIGETKDGYYMGYYSFFDDGPHIDLDFVSRNDSLLTPAMQNAYVVNRIKWFSRNYYTIRKQNNELFMYNLIFGRMNIVGRGNDNNYVFGFKISENAQEQVSMQQVETYDPNLTLGKALHLLWERFKGNRNPE